MRTWTIAVGVICLAMAGCSATTGVTVWATGDGVRVDPTTGRYFEDRTDIHADYPSGDYQQRNPVWNADGSRVALRSARNEFVAFQLVIGSDAPVGPVNVRFEELRGPDNARIVGRNIQLFRAWYLKVNRKTHGYETLSLGKGWYADALIPAPMGRLLALDIPARENAIGPDQKNQTVWVDVFVPKRRQHAPPGKYVGELVVSWPGGAKTVTVELNVWDFALPDEIHCRGDIFNVTLMDMTPAEEMRYYQMAHQHRFQPGVCFYRPKLTVEGTKVSIDWTEYDNRVGPYLDGTAFTGRHGYWGPGYGTPIDHIILPFDSEKGGNRSRAWPIPTPPDGPTPDFEAVWMETARQVKAHFDADPRRRAVKKVLFIDSLDESYNERAYEKMKYFSDLLRRGMGSRDWFQYRIDGGYSRKAMEILKDHVDLWVCHTIGYDADKMAHYRTKGVEPWFYGPMIYERRANSGSGSNTSTDLDLLTGRAIGWVSWKHKAGYCQWEFDAQWKNGRPHEPMRNWTEAINYINGRTQMNGSGLLIYHGQPVGIDGPVPSIRLKAHRRGFHDYEYFWLLKQAGKGELADQLVNSIVHGLPFGRASVGNVEIWKNNPEAWDAVRIKAGEILHAGAADQKPK